MIENNNQATSDTQKKDDKERTKALRNETAFQGYENLSKKKYITQIFTKLPVQFSLLSSNNFYVLKRVCI